MTSELVAGFELGDKLTERQRPVHKLILCEHTPLYAPEIAKAIGDTDVVMIEFAGGSLLYREETKIKLQAIMDAETIESLPENIQEEIEEALRKNMKMIRVVFTLH